MLLPKYGATPEKCDPKNNAVTQPSVEAQVINQNQAVRKKQRVNQNVTT